MPDLTDMASCLSSKLRSRAESGRKHVAWLCPIRRITPSAFIPPRTRTAGGAPATRRHLHAVDQNFATKTPRELFSGGPESCECPLEAPLPRF